MQAAPHLRIDTKVRALSTIQFNLASAVGEVHRHAGLVAAAWSNSNSERFEAGYLQRTLHESLEGLLKTMQTVSQSKSSVPGSSSRHTTQQVRFLCRFFCCIVIVIFSPSPEQLVCRSFNSEYFGFAGRPSAGQSESFEQSGQHRILEKATTIQFETRRW